MLSFDLGQNPFGRLSDHRAMNAPDKPTQGNGATEPKPSRQEEALIEEYAAGLREFIKKLRRKLFN